MPANLYMDLLQYGQGTTMETLNLLASLFGLVALIALIWLVIRAFKRNFLWGLAVLLLSPITATLYGIIYWRDDKKPFLAYITSFTAAVGLGLYVFTAWGGWEVVGSGLAVNRGIHDKNLTQQQALAYMNSGLDFLENANPGEEDARTLELMRRFINQNESNMSDADRQKLQNEILDLMEKQDLSAQDREALEQMRAQVSASSSNNTITRKVKVVSKPDNYRMIYMPIELSEASDYVGKVVKVKRKNSTEQQVLLTRVSSAGLHFERRKYGGTFAFSYRNQDIEELKVPRQEVY
jgi:hypothetical protein